MFKKLPPLFWALSILTLIFPTRTYAYLDPGTGSLVVQVVIGAIVSSAYFLKTNFTAIKSRFTRKPGTSKSTADSDGAAS